LSMLTVSHLKAEHLWLGWLPYFRVSLLSLGGLGSLVLVLGLLRQVKANLIFRLMAGCVMLFPIGLMSFIWGLVFFVW
ncbi:MAG: hypothetical protein RIR18_2284, partial [Pseudomonadota bacterium]